MAATNWIIEHWFDLFQTLGIVGGLLFTAYAVWKDERARKITNLIALNERHDYIWSKFYEKPELARVLKKDVDLNRYPISDEEWLFAKMLIIHLDTVRRAAKAGMLFEIKGIKSDIRDFLKLPIPKTVWEKIRPFQDEKFVEFVETALKK
ncbi:MAG: hypothetical protein WCS94_14625 [Verrucomicrobiota bacterium]